MATKKNEGGGAIRYDAFVKQVRPDPKQTDPISILHGYVGEGASADTVRLYADQTLSEYVDVATADILYSIPNDEDPLGGSTVWVKQQADVKYNDGGNYAEGNMYDDYMGNMYDGNYGTMGAGAATQLCTIQPTLLTRNIICRPTRFICPTPQSRLIICGQPRTIVNCPTIITRAGCPQPSLVDGCPSALGCTIHTGTTVINPGVVRQNDYTGGDVYNDYMQNMYDGDGGEANFGPQATVACTIVQTSPVVCHIVQTLVQPNCIVTLRSDCFRTINPRNCPITCGYRTRWSITLRCPIRTIACATDFTRPQTITRVVTGGIGGFQDDTATGFGADANYGYGDMYDSYMQNDYTGENMGADITPDTAAAAMPPPTHPAFCRPGITVPVQVCGVVTQVWNTRCCFTRPPQCPPTRPFATRCCVTFGVATRCCPTRPWICYRPLNTLNQCQVHP